jgi:hypothetical protein
MSKFLYLSNDAGSESWPKIASPSAAVVGYFRLDQGVPEASGTLSDVLNLADGNRAWLFTSIQGEPGVPWPTGQLNRTRVSINSLGANCSLFRLELFAINYAGDARAAGATTNWGASMTWNTTGVKTVDIYWNPAVTDTDYRFGLQLIFKNTDAGDQTVTIDTGSANSWFATAWQLGPWPAGIASTNAFGTATISQDTGDIEPAGIASTNAFGTATITTSNTISPSSIENVQGFGTPSIFEFQGISPEGIASTNAFGGAELRVTIGPAGIASTAALGTPSQTIGISPSGIASTAAVGDCTVLKGVITLAPAGIASTVAFGDFTSTLFDPVIYPSGIASTNKFGVASISGGRILTTEILYTPSFPPPEVEDVGIWTMMELLKITDSFAQMKQEVTLELTVAEPPKVHDGLVRYADGVDWDPGAGEGFYGYYQNGWHKLG